jgi:hypothetical protein
MFRVTDEHKCKAIELCEARSEHPRTAKSIIGRASISIDDSDTTILTTCAQALQGLHTRPEAGATVSAHGFARLPTTTAAVSIKEDNDNGSGGENVGRAVAFALSVTSFRIFCNRTAI